MPVRVIIPGVGERWLEPTESWQRLAAPGMASDADPAVDENFYIVARKVR
jgi:hypothetical protein